MLVSLKHNFYCAGEGTCGPQFFMVSLRENALMRHGRSVVFGAPSASLGISPADSNVRRTAQLPLALAPLGRSDSVRMTGFEGFQKSLR